jgi:hypothetical protein
MLAVQPFVQCNLLSLRQLPLAAPLFKTEVATVIGTPLAKAAVWTRVFLGGSLFAQYARFLLTALPLSNC